jgi:hypothetical protein
VRNFREGGSKVFLGDECALQHKLAQEDELAVLVLNRLGEIGGRDVTPFSQYLAESFSLHCLKARFENCALKKQTNTAV